MSINFIWGVHFIVWKKKLTSNSFIRFKILTILELDPLPAPPLMVIERYLDLDSLTKCVMYESRRARSSGLTSKSISRCSTLHSEMNLRYERISLNVPLVLALIKFRMFTTVVLFSTFAVMYLVADSVSIRSLLACRDNIDAALTVVLSCVVLSCPLVLAPVSKR